MTKEIIPLKLVEFIDGCIETVNLEDKQFSGDGVREYLYSNDIELINVGLELLSNELYNVENEKTLIKDEYMKLRYGKNQNDWP